MSITYHSEGVKKPGLRYRCVSVWIKKVIDKFDFESGNLTYIFCDDEYLKSINSKYLNHDYYTDIVTFDYNKDKVISGDMFISIERVKENAVLFHCNFTEELLRVIVHGLLHLIGYKDSSESEKAIMRKVENDCIFMYKELGDGCTKGI